MKVTGVVLIGLLTGSVSAHDASINEWETNLECLEQAMMPLDNCALAGFEGDELLRCAERMCGIIDDYRLEPLGSFRHIYKGDFYDLKEKQRWTK